METIRRVTSGVDENKVSKVIKDDEIKAFVPYEEFPSFQIQELFYTEDNPLSLLTRHLTKFYDIDLPKGAMRFMKIRMPTKMEMTRELKLAGRPIPDDWAKFNLHNTASVDYIYVISGEITCVVGSALVELKQGDFLAQIGPEHTWINDHNEAYYLFCVMIGIEAGAELKRMTI